MKLPIPRALRWIGRRARRIVASVPHAYRRKTRRAVLRVRRGVLGLPSRDPVSLSSRALGLPSDRLVVPCLQRGPGPRKPRPAEPAVGLAFSGGGFRASLAATGVLRFVADAGLLGRVRYVSSVSGGSITNGLFAGAYEQLRASRFAPEQVDELVVRPLVREISSGISLQWGLIGRTPMLALGRTRTELLADALAHRLLGAHALADIPTACRFIFNAANLATGVRFVLEPSRVGDYVLGFRPTSSREGDPLRLADAVAASAAFPGVFSPYYLEGYRFKCHPEHEPALVDGGVYDNLGLEAITHLPAHACMIAINAGGLFHTGFAGGVPGVGTLLRDNALLYRQSTSLRTRILVERFQAYEKAVDEGKDPPSFARRGVLFSIATTPRPNVEWEGERPPPPWAEVVRLAEIKTGFSRLSRDDCEALVHRAWWLAGATLSAFHRPLLDTELPRWRPLEA
jgi:NTE family protein